jgi:hypothetical protein
VPTRVLLLLELELLVLLLELELLVLRLELLLLELLLLLPDFDDENAVHAELPEPREELRRRSS